MSAARKPAPGRKPAKPAMGRFYGLLAVVGVAGVALIAYLASRPKGPARTVDTSAAPVKAQPYVLGNPNAPVKIMEFADFECPACGNYATVTGPDVKKRLVETGQASVHFYDFPLGIHRNTWDAHLAAACANDQGKFWEMHDRLFYGQLEWSGQATRSPRKVIRPYAQELGLDLAKYDQCMSDETHRPRIQANYDYATSLAVPSTPTFIIAGKLYPGSLPYDEVKKLVEQAARSAPATAAPTASPAASPATATPAAGGTP